MDGGAAVLAVVATPELPTRELLAVARAAEESGLGELWLWEDVYRQSAVAQAGAVLGATERLRIGLGVMPAPLRHVVLAAMDVATLVEMFPGRLTPGIGHGVQSWMEEIGARAASPLTLLREYSQALRPLLHGEAVTSDGRYVHLGDARLVWPPASAPPLYVGAHGPRTLRLAGEVGDGVIFQLGVSPDDARSALVTVGEGRAVRGHDGWFGVCAYVGVDADLRAEGAAATAAHLQRWVDAGATTVAVVPVTPDGEPDMSDAAGTAAWLGAEVRPLLAGDSLRSSSTRDERS
ncbi:N5,N10-methylenetetrahydromethanopterin reductase-related protein, SCO5024 family [Serinibacter arcticus]|uniref:N5,N10-methylenetetrahydromethanopterin reductase-related protein, SCO5024 family n=1 Tax=Serinibacter arcticus TaxID=1655435 RepID=A0A4Z1DZP2_9MICO|nr:N5,N10-methylenetetrahydromethanopterin reductase-related protein, SCO5024 family [Serinibacter arcticus]